MLVHIIEVQVSFCSLAPSGDRFGQCMANVFPVLYNAGVYVSNFG